MKTLSKLFSTFSRHGYELYIVGGAVRDTLLNREIKDIDFTTDARPEEIKELFTSTNDIGARFGTVQVVLDNACFEITTFRSESDYADGRHPEHIEYETSLIKDLSRRDFTINALAVDKNGALIDAFGGLDDLASKRLQTIGNPEERFQEDGLRKWRGIRFALEYGLEIKEDTFRAIVKNPDTSNISAERIREELKKILLSENASSPLLVDSGLFTSLLERLLPKGSFDKEKLKESFRPLSALPEDTVLRLTALTRDFKREELKTFLNGLKFEKRVVERVLLYNKNLDLTVHSGIIPYKRFGGRAGIEGLKDLLILQRVLKNVEGKKLKDSEESIERIEKNNEALRIKDLRINGNDLKALGYSGREIGAFLERALEYVYVYPEKNKRKILLANDTKFDIN